MERRETESRKERREIREREGGLRKEWREIEGRR